MKLPFHFQDCETFCGAACFQMAIDAQGIDVSLHAHAQANLIAFCNIIDYEFGWDMSPGGLVGGVNEVLRAKHYQMVTADPTEFSGTRAEALAKASAWIITVIREALVRKQGYVLCPTDESCHWVCLAETSPDSNSAQYNVFDPVSYASNCRITTHDSSGACAGCENKIHEGDWEPENTMKDNLAFINIGVKNTNRYLALIPNPDDAPLPSKLLFLSPPVISQPPLIITGGENLPAVNSEAQGNLWDALSGNSRRKLHGAVPGTPLFVERLERKNSEGYYLIPLHTAADTGENVVRAVAVFDWPSGKYLRLTGVEGGPVTPPGPFGSLKFLQEMPNIQKVKEFLENQTLPGAPKGQGGLINSQNVSVNETPVWRSCIQSPSPLRPFIQFSLDGREYLLNLRGEILNRSDLVPAIPPRFIKNSAQ